MNRDYHTFQHHYIHVYGLYRCWWRMLEAVHVGDKFQMLVTDFIQWNKFQNLSTVTIRASPTSISLFKKSPTLLLVTVCHLYLFFFINIYGFLFLIHFKQIKWLIQFSKNRTFRSSRDNISEISRWHLAQVLEGFAQVLGWIFRG